MESKVNHISYLSTNAFSPLVLDYLGGISLESFFAFPPQKEAVDRLLQSRKSVACDREKLVEGLKMEYVGIEATEMTLANIDLLLKDNAFTICTAHQPNLMTGPLYFIYKILHVIRLADELSKSYPQIHFIPVYYMGSEDADIHELGVVHVFGKEIRWKTEQKGAVGRMLVDEMFQLALSQLKDELTSFPFGQEVMSMVEACYQPGITMELASFRLVNALFGKFGLVIFTPDRPHYKAAFVQEMIQEMEVGLSGSILQKTIAKFPEAYKIQAQGRDVNLFYLKDDSRVRISRKDGRLGCPETGYYWENDAWKEELVNHPERFSPNVILRPLFQEKLLPNLIVVGGGGELSYWLELKDVFDGFDVHYPMLLLRNSFMLVKQSHRLALHELHLEWEDLFRPQHQLEELLVRKHTVIRVELKQELEKLNELYDQVLHTAGQVDSTLKGHVEALRKKSANRLEKLEKKMLSAEKRKFREEIARAASLKEQLFPAGHLQERQDNILPWLAEFGFPLLSELLECSLGFEQKFSILELT